MKCFCYTCGGIKFIRDVILLYCWLMAQGKTEQSCQPRQEVSEAGNSRLLYY